MPKTKPETKPKTFTKEELIQVEREDLPIYRTWLQMKRSPSELLGNDEFLEDLFYVAKNFLNQKKMGPAYGLSFSEFVEKLYTEAEEAKETADENGFVVGNKDIDDWVNYHLELLIEETLIPETQKALEKELFTEEVGGFLLLFYNEKARSYILFLGDKEGEKAISWVSIEEDFVQVLKNLSFWEDFPVFLFPNTVKVEQIEKEIDTFLKEGGVYFLKNIVFPEQEKKRKKAKKNNIGKT